MRSIFLSAFLVTAALPAGASSWTTGTYVYDGSGNITAIGTDVYRYDAFGRLKTSTARTPANANAQTFTYDPYGNLKLIETVGGVPLYVPVNPATNHIDGTGTPPPGSTVVSATYDEAGNQTSLNGAYTYTYDALGMMTTLTSGTRVEQYLYDADDQRIATVYGGTPQRWRYTLRDLDGRFVREYVDEVSGQTHSWRWTRDYLYAGGRLLATIVASDRAGGESRQHFHLDHLGTPRLITDDGGNLLARHTLQPFGAEALGSTRDSEVIKFTGHERDYAGAGDGNDLDYMHARYYGPMHGRFLSMDPGGYYSERPQTWNRYAYVENNPVESGDPDGRERPFRPTAWDWQRVSLDAQTVDKVVVGPGWGQQLSDAWDGFKEAPSTRFIVETFPVLLAMIADQPPAKATEPNIADPGIARSVSPQVKGAIGEQLSQEAAVARGEVVRGTQITVRSASNVRTRVDVVTATPGGNVKLIESKNGPHARLTPNQRKALPEIQQTGSCTPCGKNAEKAGFKPGEKIANVEVQIDRHNQ
jgi:RHS repeat-associated protein